MVDSAVDRRIEEYFMTHREEMLEDLASLVKIPSVVSSPLPGMPYGKAAHDALTAAAEIAERMGFHTTISDDCCMTADYGDRPNRLSLMAHLDVVEAGSGWTRPAYALSRENEWLYGRGVADNKGPCVALLHAMQAARQIAPGISYSPQVWFGTAEEVGSPDLRAYIQNHTLPEYALTPDALEPIVIGESAKYRPEFFREWTLQDVRPQVIDLQGGKVRNAIPGSATAVVAGTTVSVVESAAQKITKETAVEFELFKMNENVEIHAKGKGAHIGRPELGRNAQTALIALLNALPLAPCAGTEALRALGALFPCDDPFGKALGLTLQDDVFGHAQVNFTVCRMTEQDIRCKMDGRGPLVSRPENFSNVIDHALKSRGFTLVPSTMDDAHYVPENTPIVQKMRILYERYFGQPVSCGVTTGASYAHYVPGAVSTGVATVGIDTMLHKADERILVEDIMRVGMIYTQAIMDLCEGGS